MWEIGQRTVLGGEKSRDLCDTVLQTRSRLCDGKVHGPDDRLVSETLKRLPLVKIFEVANVFQEGFMGKEHNEQE